VAVHEVGEAGPLRLEDALAMALQAHPELTLQAAQSDAAAGRVEQAGIRPRPAASLELEDAFGSGPYDGFDSSQTTLSLSQTLELGGKRGHRRVVAREEERLLERAHEVQRVEVLRATARAFLRVLRAQEEVEFAGQLRRMQEELVAARQEQIRVGRIPESEKQRSVAALALAKVQCAQAHGELQLARQELALHLGLSEPLEGELVHALEIPTALPELEELRARLVDNAQLLREEAGVSLSEALLEREEAARVPDPELSLGVRRYEEGVDHALVVGISLPLAFGGQNRGDLRAARAALVEAAQRRELVRRRLGAQLAAGHSLLQSTLAEVRTLEDEVLPAAEQSYADSENGFRLGSIDYLELRQAQDTLIGARRQLSDARIRFLEAAVDLQALTDDFDIGNRR
jgi:cobalt-zinc-cadmium efflux system outer membrane protein